MFLLRVLYVRFAWLLWRVCVCCLYVTYIRWLASHSLSTAFIYVFFPYLNLNQLVYIAYALCVQYAPMDTFRCCIDSNGCPVPLENRKFQHIARYLVRRFYFFFFVSDSLTNNDICSADHCRCDLFRFLGSVDDRRTIQILTVWNWIIMFKYGLTLCGFGIDWTEWNG